MAEFSSWLPALIIFAVVVFFITYYVVSKNTFKAWKPDVDESKMCKMNAPEH